MAKTNQRPNILLIIGEDTGRTLACYGDPTAVAHNSSPNLDRLASEGCRYDAAWTTCPVCAPARSTIITGQYPIKIGTHQMRSRLLKPPRLFTQELRDAGYWVNWHSKMDFNFNPDDAPDQPWCDDREPWLERLANNQLPDKPWFLYINIGTTHESGMWPDPEPRDRPGRFGGGHPRAPRVTDPDRVFVPPYLPDTPVVRQDIARHYDNLHSLDKQVGQILAALDASGQANNTYVIFLADHGRGLAREKRWCYPAGLHMPLIVRGPGIEPGSTSQRLVSWVDIAPTILSLAGVKQPADYDGSAFLGQYAEKPREVCFAGRDRMDEAFDRVRVATDGEYLYIRNYFPQIPYAQRNKYMEIMPTTQELRRLHAAGQLKGDAGVWMQYPKPPEELYHLPSDPYALHNLIGHSAHAQAHRRLVEQLEQWLAQTDDKGAYTERELIARGLVEDHLAAYRARIEPLPAEYRIADMDTVLEPADLPKGRCATEEERKVPLPQSF